jgi:alpha-beta hydrolase superfamily lysophospholipase
VRGQGTFDPEALTRVLTPLPEADLAIGRTEPLEDYYGFYHLDFSDRNEGLVHTVGWLPSGEHRIVVQRFEHPDPSGTAVVCHGYYDHVGLYGYLIEFLLEQKLTVVTFDQPGHGLSSGPRATIGSFDEYVQVLTDVLVHYQSALPGPWYIIGQSMGGAITMEYLARQKDHGFRQVVLLAPLIRPANWRLARIAYLLARYTIKERPRTITDNAENPEFLALMRRDPLAPMVLPVQWVSAMVDWMKRFESRAELPFEPLVVQGHADETVDWRHNMGVLREKTRPNVLEIPAARHHLVNESDLIRQQIFDWLAPHFKGDSQ